MLAPTTMYILNTAFFFAVIGARVVAQAPNSSWPEVYPGHPNGELSPEWQTYYEVNQSLPNVTFTLTRSFAGNIAVNRSGHDNDTLFFWAYEKQNGSLTNNASTDPWVIWLQGGPGSSSLFGLLLENGPIRLQDDLSFRYNNYSWSNLADTFWIDNPVGTGFSTSDSTGYVSGGEQAGTDFVGFLSNLVKVFPSLATRPLVIVGESYAGQWIPYVAKALFSTPNPPVHLAKIAIGDGTIGNEPAFGDTAVVSLIETYPQVIDYDTEVLNYFRKQTRLCGFDLNFTYPQSGGHFPTLTYPEPTDRRSPYASSSGNGSSRALRLSFSRYKRERILEYAQRTSGMRSRSMALGPEQEAKRILWKREVTNRTNDTIDPWYACHLQDQLFAYMLNFTMPWSEYGRDAFDVYDLSDGLYPKPYTSPSVQFPPVFLRDNRTVTALHAPTGKEWVESINYPFAGSGDDSSPVPQTFFDTLASNASAKGVGVILYSGNDDALCPHHGTEVVIQNTTFDGTQGFTSKPSTPWYDDNGTFAGIVHSERNWTYVLFYGASHTVPLKVPAAAYVFMREFVLGSNQTGLVDGNNNSAGGSSAQSVPGVLPASAVYGGSYSTTTTYSYASETVSAWKAFVSNMEMMDEAGTLAQTSVATGTFPARLALSLASSVLTAAFLSF